MRTLLGLLGAAVFVSQWLWYYAPGTGYDDTGALLGDPAAIAVTGAVRTLSFGFAIVSLAILNWAPVDRAIAALFMERPRADV